MAVGVSAGALNGMSISSRPLLPMTSSFWCRHALGGAGEAHLPAAAEIGEDGWRACRS